LFVAAKVSARVQQIVTEAAELSSDELDALAEAIEALPRGREAVAERHAIIAERIARVHGGAVETLSVEEVERSLRDELDF
jgi:hypothetical protein